MSFAGSVQAMITTLKNNARNRTTLYDRNQKTYRSRIKKAYKTANTAKPEQLKVIRLQLIRENKNRMIKVFTSTAIILIIMLLILT